MFIDERQQDTQEFMMYFLNVVEAATCLGLVQYLGIPYIQLLKLL